MNVSNIQSEKSASLDIRVLVLDTLSLTVCSMEAASELTWTYRSDASVQRVKDRVSRISIFHITIK